MSSQFILSSLKIPIQERGYGWLDFSWTLSKRTGYHLPSRKLKPENYRLISLTSVTLKLLGRVIFRISYEKEKKRQVSRKDENVQIRCFHWHWIYWSETWGSCFNRTTDCHTWPAKVSSAILFLLFPTLLPNWS